MLSQKKIELAVLLKLYQLAEANEQPRSVGGITGAFEDFEISNRRVEVALDQLFVLGQVEIFQDRNYGHNVWAITREGFDVVDRALRVPAAFLARLNSEGDRWLASEEAQKAKLKKLVPDQPLQSAPQPEIPDEPTADKVGNSPIHITNNFTPSNTIDNSKKVKQPQSSTVGWLTLAAAIVIGAITIAIMKGWL